jgi:hypothetical protein
MKKYIFRISIALCFISAFLFGRYQGTHYSESYISQLNENITTLNDVPAYWGYANISNNISEKNYRAAKCTSDLLASAKFGKIQICLQSAKCKEIIIEEVKKNAPELLMPESNIFAYYKNLKHCN